MTDPLKDVDALVRSSIEKQSMSAEPLRALDSITNEMNEIIRASPSSSAACDRLRRWIERHMPTIERIAGADEAESFSGCISSFSMLGSDKTLKHWRDSLTSFLTGLAQDIKAHPEEFPRKVREKAITGTDKSGKPYSNDVFVVHGRDAALRETVCRMLERLGLTPVILAEQAHQGQTIIEKFERHAKVGYAIVLLTGDDEGKLIGAESDMKHRARQNVVFELGFFIGKLGRNRVACLADRGLEIPSDIQGLGYIEADQANGWQLAIAKELKVAGYQIDLNALLR